MSYKDLIIISAKSIDVFSFFRLPAVALRFQQSIQWQYNMHLSFYQAAQLTQFGFRVFIPMMLQVGAELTSVPLFVCFFQVRISSRQHWYLPWRRSKTQEWWVALWLRLLIMSKIQTVLMHRYATETSVKMNMRAVALMWIPMIKGFHDCLTQITVSSGGMLTQKLNVDDLQFEKGTFDGTMAYAQNKVKDTGSKQELHRTYGMSVFIDMLLCFHFIP